MVQTCPIVEWSVIQVMAVVYLRIKKIACTVFLLYLDDVMNVDSRPLCLMLVGCCEY